MAYTKIQVLGLKELEDALNDLPRAVARGTLTRALKKTAQPIADDEKRRVRVRSGETRDSVIVTTKVRNQVGLQEYGETIASGGSREEAVGALRAARRAGGSDGARAEVSIGPTKFTAVFLERGTFKMPAFPFVRPAWEAGKYRALDDISTQLKNEIDKSVARAARKAARLAAKG